MVTDISLGKLAFPTDDKVMSEAIRWNGQWDPPVLEWLGKNVGEGDLCLNVGANVGYFTAHMSRLVGPEGKVIAVEPRRDLVRLLKGNLRRLSIRNVEIHEVVATSAEGAVSLYVNRGNAGDNRVFDPRSTDVGGTYLEHGFRRAPRVQPAEGVRVDSILAGRAPHVCLLDTQGWEHRVIRGMTETLRHHRPKMLVEFVPGWLSDLGEEPQRILEEYLTLGYSLSILQGNPEETVTPEEILQWVQESSGYFCDLILSPA